VRAMVEKIPEAELASLMSTHHIVSSVGSTYCTVNQSLVEDGLRRLGYAVVRDAQSWRVTRSNGETLVGSNVCRIALLALFLDVLPAQ
jgi:hypothetical protein